MGPVRRADHDEVDAPLHSKQGLGGVERGGAGVGGTELRPSLRVPGDDGGELEAGGCGDLVRLRLGEPRLQIGRDAAERVAPREELFGADSRLTVLSQ